MHGTVGRDFFIPVLVMDLQTPKICERSATRLVFLLPCGSERIFERKAWHQLNRFSREWACAVMAEQWPGRVRADHNSAWVDGSIFVSQAMAERPQIGTYGYITMATATDHHGTDAHTAAIQSVPPSRETAPQASAGHPEASAHAASVAPSSSEKTPPDLALAAEATTEIVIVLKLFADETRVKILAELLHAGEANVQTLCRTLGQTQPAVSHHLALLKEAKMVEMRRSGKHNFYRVSDSPRERVLEAMAPLFEIPKQGSASNDE